MFTIVCIQLDLFSPRLQKSSLLHGIAVTRSQNKNTPCGKTFPILHEQSNTVVKHVGNSLSRVLDCPKHNKVERFSILDHKNLTPVL